jgi:hypothetical protein
MAKVTFHCPPSRALKNAVSLSPVVKPNGPSRESQCTWGGGTFGRRSVTNQSGNCSLAILRPPNRKETNQRWREKQGRCAGPGDWTKPIGSSVQAARPKGCERIGYYGNTIAESNRTSNQHCLFGLVRRSVAPYLSSPDSSPELPAHADLPARSRLRPACWSRFDPVRASDTRLSVAAGRPRRISPVAGSSPGRWSIAHRSLSGFGHRTSTPSPPAMSEATKMAILAAA